MVVKRQEHDFQGLGGRSAQVFESLRHDIRAGVFSAGSKLPTEKALCERFGVTRPTVRKGISHLVREGLVVVRAGAGMFVCRPPVDGPPASVSRTVSVMFHFDAESLQAVQTMALEAGFLLCTYSQRDWLWDPARERQFLEAVKTERRRALIAFCSPREPRNGDLLAELDALGTRVVHIEPYGTELPGQSYVIADYEAAGATAATELLLAGCRSFVFLPMSAAPFEILIERGYARALNTHGPGFDPARSSFRIDNLASADAPSSRALAAFLAGLPRPVGILCRAAHNAASVLDVLARLRWTVPGDARIVAVDQSGGRNNVPVDQLVFDHLAHARRAIAAVGDPAWRGLRELVKPTLVRRRPDGKKECGAKRPASDP